MSVGEQAQLNAEYWRAGGHVGDYASRVLLPVEVLLLARYREQLSGRVVELGCGAGRVLGYLVALGGEAHGIDIAPEMVRYTREAYPQADVRVGDLAALPESLEGRYDAIVAIDNVLDVFDDAQRRAVLARCREFLAPGGVLIFSSHNLASLDPLATASTATRTSGGGRTAKLKAGWRFLVSKPPAELPQLMRRIPTRMRNRKRLAPLQRREPDHAIVNDHAHDYGLLHYYIDRAGQALQLAELGYELLECLEPSGDAVPAGERGAGPWLHYVARSRPESEL
jgi:SAM-dependent methyltransferase